MVAESVASQNSERYGVVTRVANQLGIGIETLRYWVKQADRQRHLARDHDRGAPAHRRAREGEQGAAPLQRDLEGGSDFLSRARLPMFHSIEYAVLRGKSHRATVAATLSEQ
jgi:transposase-like protein